MGKDGKGWKGKGKPPLRSEGERQHARAVNAARAAEGLPNKSTGSVSRSKARALAHREKSQAVPADYRGAGSASRDSQVWADGGPARADQ